MYYIWVILATEDNFMGLIFFLTSGQSVTEKKHENKLHTVAQILLYSQ